MFSNTNTHDDIRILSVAVIFDQILQFCCFFYVISAYV